MQWGQRVTVFIADIEHVHIVIKYNLWLLCVMAKFIGYLEYIEYILSKCIWFLN